MGVTESVLITPDSEAKAKIELLFSYWNERLLRGSTAHFLEAMKYEYWEYVISVINIVFAISVLFLSAMGGNLKFPVFTDFVLPIASLFVVLISAFQYISQFGQKASQHKLAAVEYANLRRKLERYWTKKELHPEAIHSLTRSYNGIAKYPPLISEKQWNKVADMKKDRIKQINAQFFHFDLERNDIELYGNDF